MSARPSGPPETKSATRSTKPSSCLSKELALAFWLISQGGEGLPSALGEIGQRPEEQVRMCPCPGTVQRFYFWSGLVCVALALALAAELRRAWQARCRFFFFTSSRGSCVSRLAPDLAHLILSCSHHHLQQHNLDISVSLTLLANVRSSPGSALPP